VKSFIEIQVRFHARCFYPDDPRADFVELDLLVFDFALFFFFVSRFTTLSHSSTTKLLMSSDAPFSGTIAAPAGDFTFSHTTSKFSESLMVIFFRRFTYDRATAPSEEQAVYTPSRLCCERNCPTDTTSQDDSRRDHEPALPSQ
jgi:hypothetical protein